MKKNLLAIGIGLIISAAILLCAEGIFILNRKYSFLSRPQMHFPDYGTDAELMDLTTAKFLSSRWAHQNEPHFFAVEQQASPSDKIDYSLKYGPKPARLFVFGKYSILKPNVQYRSFVKMKESGRVVYDVTVGIDERSRRVVPPNVWAQDRGILFFGDSNTFGEGVNDAETFAAQFARLNPQYQVFNFGIGASSPAVFLDEVEKHPELRYADAKMPSKNIGIFCIIDDTVERMIFRLNYFRRPRNLMWTKPYYTLNSEGVPQYHGTFVEGRQVVNTVYSFFGHSALLDFFNVDFPPTLMQSDLDFMAIVIKTYGEKLKKYMNLDRLIVASLPGSRLDPEKYKKAFAKADIEFWDFSRVNLSQVTQGQHIYPWDYHLTPLGHYLVAELLSYKLEKTRDKSILTGF